MRGFHLQNPVHPASCLISLSIRSPDQPASLVVSSSGLPDIALKMSRGLGRESELVRVCCCLFDPFFNEANESSSACHPDCRLPVETRTPPVSVDVALIVASGLAIVIIDGRRRAVVRTPTPEAQ